MTDILQVLRPILLYLLRSVHLHLLLRVDERAQKLSPRTLISELHRRPPLCRLGSSYAIQVEFITDSSRQTTSRPDIENTRSVVGGLLNRVGPIAELVETPMRSIAGPVVKHPQPELSAQTGVGVISDRVL
jgi:hypothetical protein